MRKSKATRLLLKFGDENDSLISRIAEVCKVPQNVETIIVTVPKFAEQITGRLNVIENRRKLSREDKKTVPEMTSIEIVDVRNFLVEVHTGEIFHNHVLLEATAKELTAVIKYTTVMPLGSWKTLLAKIDDNYNIIGEIISPEGVVVYKDLFNEVFKHHGEDEENLKETLEIAKDMVRLVARNGDYNSVRNLFFEEVGKTFEKYGHLVKSAHFEHFEKINRMIRFYRNTSRTGMIHVTDVDYLQDVVLQ